MNHFVGIDLGGTEFKIGVISEQGDILRKESFRTELAGGGARLIEHMANSARAVVERAGLDIHAVGGVGIGSAGLLDPIAGQVNNSVNLQILNGLFLGPDLSRLLGVPVCLDNDVNAMALGEMRYGAAKGFSDVVCMTLGTGVGGGLIFGGVLYRGATYTAGEIGHMSIDADGLICPCGNYGCLERYIGRDGIVNRFKAYYSKGIPSSIEEFLDKGEITPLAISQAALANDSLAIEVLYETGRYLGIALASLANVLNPEVFVIGGGITNAGDLILEPARREMQKRAYTIPAQKARVVQAKLGNDAGIVGSATLAMLR